MSTLNIKQLPNIPASKIINFENNVKNVIDAFTTNCITKIPQNVKLELNSGVLTLKAGSKVYIPNGFEQDGITKKFDEVIIENDASYNGEFDNRQLLALYDVDNDILWNTEIVDASSGPTQPTFSNQFHCWYDTVNNILKCTRDYGTTWFKCSIPVGFVTDGSTGIQSIDKIFQGFSYLGSSIFTLPGIEALFPDGKNEDGSYNNILATTNSVIVNTSLTADTNTACLLKLTNVSNEWVVSDIIQQTSAYSYDSFNNIWTNSGNEVKCCFVVSIETDSNSKVSSFNSKTTLSICDNNNIQIVSDLPDNPIEGVLYLIPEI